MEKLNSEDLKNIEMALRYVIYDMRSNFFKDSFSGTLSKIEILKGDC